MKKFTAIILLSVLLIAVVLGLGQQRLLDQSALAKETGTQDAAMTSEGAQAIDNSDKSQISQVTSTGEKKMKTIYFAGGCFWGMERLMSVVTGVEDAQSGYANGIGDNPTYEQVVRGNTGYRETVKVVYDDNVIGTRDLLRLFFGTIDPTVTNRQGNDVGSQYQTGVYWEDAEDEAVIREAAEAEKAQQKVFNVEIEPLTTYWPAEEYHQDYLVKNPQGYCHIGPADFEVARNLVKE